MGYDGPERRSSAYDMAEIKSDLKHLVKDVDDIKEKLEKHYVTIDAFEPIKKGFYWQWAVIITSLMSLLGMWITNAIGK